MREKIAGIKNTLNSSIFVGERLEKNLKNMTNTSVIVMLLGFVMTVVNVVQRQYTVALSPLMIFLAGLASYISASKFKSRTGVIVVTMTVVIIVLTYDVLFVKNGFAYLWTMLVPLSVSYMFSIKMGIFITAYFEILFITAFLGPLRPFVAPRYAEIVMSRFPILFFFHGLLVLYIMYQYHKSVLFEIDHTDKLNEEVAKQTAVAEERSRKIEQLSFETIQTLAHAIDAKDPYTKGHSTRVSRYSVMIAEALGWNQSRVNELRYAALLHDIGKIGIPDSILNKPRRLTEVEYNIIKSHTTLGSDILRNRIMISSAADVAESHHERYDGRGYPHGLNGTQLSEEARIVAIADAFDAMSSDRVYRKAIEPERIRQEMIDGKGKQFDPDFTDVFISLWNQGLLDDIMKNGPNEENEDMEASSALLQEVMEAFASQNEMESIDVTTGILNRADGENAIAQIMKKENGCFVFFDLDNLKKINDNSGHDAGDKALRFVGDTLRENCGNNLCCRLGGDEFLLFLKGVTKEDAEIRVRKILNEFNHKKNAFPETAPASLSAGLVMCTPSDTYTKVFRKADKALYSVKQKGKNDLSFYLDQSGIGGNEPLDMDRLVDGIHKSGSYKGALDVEYRQFAKLYEYIANLEKRYAHPFTLIMITLESSDEQEPSPEESEAAMTSMEISIRRAIRNVDVVTRYGRNQFLVIIFGADEPGVNIAAERIFRSYYKTNGSFSFSPSYKIVYRSENVPHAVL